MAPVMSQERRREGRVWVWVLLQDGDGNGVGGGGGGFPYSFPRKSIKSRFGGVFFSCRNDIASKKKAIGRN